MYPLIHLIHSVLLVTDSVLQGDLFHTKRKFMSCPLSTRLCKSYYVTRIVIFSWNGMTFYFYSFGRRRVVIRKGHVAQRFYFIFSGSVCVTVDDDAHSAFAKPTENAVLRRGDHFGVCTVYAHALGVKCPS